MKTIPQEIQKALKLVKAGKSITAASQSVGTYPQRLYYWASKQGLYKTTPREQKPKHKNLGNLRDYPLDKGAVRRAYKVTGNLSDVARIFQVSRQRVHQIVRYES